MRMIGRVICGSVFICLLAAPASVLAQTPLLRYSFDDQTNPTADSGSGTPAPGGINGTSQFITTTPGGFSAAAWDTNGGPEGNNVAGGDAAKLDNLSALTLTTWVNLQANPTGNDRIISKRNGTTAEGFFDLTFVPTGGGSITATGLRVQLGIDNGTTEASYRTNDVSFGGLNQWVFIAATYDGSGVAGAAAQFYIGSETAPAVALTKSADGAGIGAAGDNAASFAVADIGSFSGDRTSDAFFDDVRVYDSVLTPAQIEAIRASNVPEPSTMALCGLTVAAALARRRSRA